MKQRTAEQRAHRRIRTKLPGRYALADRREFPCTVIDVSLGGIALTGPRHAKIGDAVSVYISRLGQVAGEVVRQFDGGFAVQLTITTRATESFAERLAALEAEPMLWSMPDATETASQPQGITCTVVDLSLSGANVRVSQPPEVGAMVRLGQSRGRVVQRSKSGAAIKFVDFADHPTFTERMPQAVAPERPA